MKILFLGQKTIGERCFELLIQRQDCDHRVAGVVSNQDRENVWWKSNGIYQYCLEHKLPFINNNKPNEEMIVQMINNVGAEFLISVGHQWILSKRVLSSVSGHAVNLHLAKLPDYRGNFSYNHAILNGDASYGVTLHWMTEEVDRGDYIDIREFPILEDDTAYSLYQKSLDEGAKAFQQFIDRFCSGESLPHKPMQGEGRFYSRKSLEGMREIRDIHDEEEMARKSRAFYFPPFEEAYVQIAGRKYYILPEKGGYIRK